MSERGVKLREEVMEHVANAMEAAEKTPRVNMADVPMVLAVASGLSAIACAVTYGAELIAQSMKRLG
jgi:hypothetical protein